MRTLREQRNVTVGAGDVVLVPYNPRRKSVMISTPSTARIWLNFTGPAAVGVGISLAPNQTPLKLSYADIDDSVHEEIRAISEGAPQVIGVLDFFG